jgi:signal transduction histidine kinase
VKANRIRTGTEYESPHGHTVRAAARDGGRGSAGGSSPREGPGITVEIEAGAAAAAQARAALASLDGHIPGAVLEDIRLLVSELVTNSVRHSGARNGERLRLDVRSMRDTVRVEVTDPGGGFEPRERTKARDEPGGWGLHLVDRIAPRWGVITGRRARVWFELDR